jgi:hypothetical protein
LYLDENRTETAIAVMLSISAGVRNPAVRRNSPAGLA